MKNKCERKFIEGTFKTEPIRPINKSKSRFAYKITVGRRKIKGEWRLEGSDISGKAFIFQKIGCKQ